uniref:CSON005985 protein n=1 Tax=Culicoides sonorensis TaxID=179676 RepID=A0A336LZC4_CULSO
MDEYDSRPDPRLEVSLCGDDDKYDLRVGEGHFEYIGLVLIFNQIEFESNPDNPDDVCESRSEEPGKEIEELMEELGFKVFYYKDLKRTEITNKIGKFATMRRRDKIKYASLMVFFLSHGNITRDYDMLISDTWKHFEHTDSWNNKPKIFVFQTCRGKDLVEGVKVEQRRSSHAKIDFNIDDLNVFETDGPSRGYFQGSGSGIIKGLFENTSLDFNDPQANRQPNDIYQQILHNPLNELSFNTHTLHTHQLPIPFTEPKFSDLLIFHPTYQGATSFTEISHIPFISTMLQNIRNDIFTKDLLSIFQKIQQEIAYNYHASDRAQRDAAVFESSDLEGSRQMPSIQSTLTGKVCYTNPRSEQLGRVMSSCRLPNDYNMTTGKGKAIIFANKYNGMCNYPPMPYVTCDVNGLKRSFDFIKCDYVEVSELWQPFLGSRCPTLVDKPKFFIISAIGVENHFGCPRPGISGKFKQFVKKDVNIENTRALNHEVQDSQEETPQEFVIPEAADFLILFHSASGTANYMNFLDDCMDDEQEVDVQSPFFKILNEELQNGRNFVGDRHILDLVQRFQYKMTHVIREKVNYYRNGSMKREVPLMMSTLTKNFVLSINEDT